MTSAWEKAGVFYIYFVINMSSPQLSLVLCLKIPSQERKTTWPWYPSVTYQWVKVFWSRFCFSGFFFLFPSWSSQLIIIGLSGNAIHFCDLINVLLELEEFQQKFPLTLWRLAFTSLLLRFILCRSLVAFIWYVGKHVIIFRQLINPLFTWEWCT